MNTSAGLVPFRRLAGGLEVLVAHPGGPLWAHRHEGWWSIVKGEVQDGEDPLQAARREFAEETGFAAPEGGFVDLGETTQRSGKRVVAWAVEADFDLAGFRPGLFTMFWKGARQRYPEVDRIEWCAPERARRLLNPAQIVFVTRLEERVG
jgi:predicted NUDIX family NTP pyrophosphohydrolase